VSSSFVVVDVCVKGISKNRIKIIKFVLFLTNPQDWIILYSGVAVIHLLHGMDWDTVLVPSRFWDSQWPTTDCGHGTNKDNTWIFHHKNGGDRRSPIKMRLKKKCQTGY
jgi:hypothetical protein